MVTWNYGVMWKGIALADPARPAQMFGDVVYSWGEFHQRSNALADDMLAAGLGSQAKVAHYLYNCPEYLEATFASYLAGYVPVNTNYRYGPEEITYLFDNSDAEAVVFHAVFADLCAQVRPTLPKVKRWYMVPDESGTALPSWAVDYNTVVTKSVADIVPPTSLSDDDMLFLYTGGTTGMPKGVMWRQEDLLQVLGRGGNAITGVAPAESMEEVIGRVQPFNTEQRANGSLQTANRVSVVCFQKGFNFLFC